MYRFYLSPQTLDEALALKAAHGAHARVIAGGTDLLIEMDRGVRAAPDGADLGVIDLTRIPDLAAIRADATHLHLGPLVTHNQCVGSPLVVAHAFPLARACWEVGAPQIRNRATVVGNVITASPANDTIVPLMAMDATVTVASAARGVRTLPLARFITGFRRVDLADDEIVTGMSVPKLQADERGSFIKLGLRRAQAISVVSAAATVQRVDDVVTRARIALGAVAPVIVRATAAEAYLRGKQLTDDVIAAAARLALDAATPIDDIRATGAYRRAMVETLVARLLRSVRDGTAYEGWPEQPVMLWGQTEGVWPVPAAESGPGSAPDVLPVAQVNGRAVELPGGMTLLDSLRDAGFVGVKEGCAEGECGACTVFLDGMAVMACMVPAERAYGSAVVTVEGVGDAAHMHPVQQAFVDAGGVQCGYCTPGFIMSAAKLLEERPRPTLAEAQEALTGNFCRCTGYRKIVEAVLAAGALKAEVDHAGEA